MLQRLELVILLLGFALAHTSIFSVLAFNQENSQAIGVENMGKLAEIHQLREHNYKIIEIAIEGDHHLIYAVSIDGSVLLWNLNDIDNVIELGIYPGLTKAAIHLDEHLLVCNCDDTSPINDIRLIDLSSGKELAVISDIFASNLDISSDGKLVGAARALGRLDSAALVWEIPTLNPANEFSHDFRFVRDVAFRPNFPQLAAGDEEKIIIWDIVTGLQVAEMKQYYPLNELGGLFMPVEALEYNSDGSLLASLSNDLSIWVWDTETNEALFSILNASSMDNQGDYSNEDFDLAFSDEDSLLAYTCAIGVCIIDTHAGNIIKTIEYHASSISFASNDTLLALGNRDGVISIWGIVE